MAPNSIIAVLLNIGHRANHRSIVHPHGYTHDWCAYVEGANGIDINRFVEKVIFTLHETFVEPVQVVKVPPYMIRESGYASFGLKLEIHFNNTSCRNGENVVSYEYDLYLPGEGQPSVKHFRQERLLFKNTPPDFRARLLAGGAKETDPEALAEMVREEEKAGGSSAGDGRHKSGSDEDKKEKKKKSKDKSSKHKKSKAEREKTSRAPSIGDTPSSLFGLPRSPEDKVDKAQHPKRNVSHTDSSSSSSSASGSPDVSPPLMPAPSDSQEIKGKSSTMSVSDSTSASDDEDEDRGNNNTSAASKRPNPASHNSNNNASKKSKASERASKKSERNSGNGAVSRGPNGVPLDVLLELHEKIRATDSPVILQKFVDVVEECGKYKLTDTSFDFDLCMLDATVIQRLEGIFK